MHRKLTDLDTGCWMLDARRRRLLSHKNRVSSIGNRASGLTPLEIPKRASLVRRVEQSLTARIRIWGKKRRFLTGFTITEVVVASALLIIAVVPILKALTSAHVSTAVIERKTRSFILAQSKLDEIRARSIYREHWWTEFTKPNISLDGPYLCNVQDTLLSPNLRGIMVSVGYDLNDNGILALDEVEITLATYIAKR